MATLEGRSGSYSSEPYAPKNNGDDRVTHVTSVRSVTLVYDPHVLRLKCRKMSNLQLQHVVYYDGVTLKERRLILTRFNNDGSPFTLVVSGSSEDSKTRKFYFRWSKCEHKKKIVTLDPPDLAHYFSVNIFTDGTVLAAICADCCEDSLLVTCPNLFVESGEAEPIYHVKPEELSLLLDDEEVYLLGNSFYVTKGDHLPIPVLALLEKVELEGVNLKLSRFAVTQCYKKMSVAEARNRENPEVICLD